MSGVGALGAGTDTAGTKTFQKGNVVLDRAAGAYTRIDAGYRSIWTTGAIVGTVPGTSGVFARPDRVLILEDKQASLYDLTGNRMKSRRLPADFDSRLVTVAPA